MKCLTMNNFLRVESMRSQGESELYMHVFLLSKFHRIDIEEIKNMDMAKIGKLSLELQDYMDKINVDAADMKSVVNFVDGNDVEATDRIKSRSEILDL
jgi:hypothetical protein